MTVPTVTVIQGVVETEDGKVFEFDSFKASMWLESVISFRFTPVGSNKPYTVRKEVRPGGTYWYGYRKVAGRLHKKYIGKTPELNTRKLEEIAEILNIPPQPRVKDKVTHKVDSSVTHEEANSRETDRLTVLEQQIKALQDSFQALREELLGKSPTGDSEELPNKVNNQVVEGLQNELSNLKADNEWLREKLAESRSTVEALSWETKTLNDQLEVLQVENQRLHTALGNLETQKEELAQLKEKAAEIATEAYREGRSIELEKNRWQGQLSNARSELADAKATILTQGNRIRELEQGYSLKPNLKQKLAAAGKNLPEAAEILNQLKSKRKKSKTDLADLEVILEILES